MILCDLQTGNHLFTPRKRDIESFIFLIQDFPGMRRILEATQVCDECNKFRLIR